MGSAGGLDGARIALFVGAAAFAGLYILVIYMLHGYMLKIWDAGRTRTNSPGFRPSSCWGW